MAEAMPRTPTEIRSDPFNRQAGFSFVEIMIAVLISTIVLFAIYLVYASNLTTAAWGNKKVELQQNARVALDMMEREIRMAGYDPQNTGAAAIQSTPLNASDLIFTADVDGDNVTEKVQYTFNAASQTITRSLWRWNGTGWTSISTNEVVADGVSSLAPSHINCDGTINPTTTTAPFTYCDGNNKSTSTPASVRKITIAITASGMAGNKLQTFSFASDVRLRNL